MDNLLLIIIFWGCFFLVVYPYLGYGIVLYLLVRIKRIFAKQRPFNLSKEALPEVTLVVAAYNEERWIEDKIQNSFALDYPKARIQYFFVTDGSEDNTTKIIEQFPLPKGIQLQLFHQAKRKGKIAAVERIMPFVKTPLTVFTDANSIVNKEAIVNLVQHYQNPAIGAVAGEKRIAGGQAGDASGAGEGIYWKYESLLKKWDAELYSVVGAAGELFSIRTKLFEPVPPDTIIEDFYMTLRIAQKGYRVAYEPGAYAVEGQSASVGEELKRKIRIAAGGLQAVWRLRPLLNPFKYGILTFQYFSHRVLRWTLAPLALPILLITNTLLASTGASFYQILLACQLLFYLLAFLGYHYEKRQLKFKAFFVPYYFCVMNYAVYRGFLRIISGKQSVLWERAKRA